MEWQPIETAPKDVLHVRALWVYSAQTKRPVRWEAIAGYFDDETGEFCDHDGNSPWRADDYTHWMPLPKPPTT